VFTPGVMSAHLLSSILNRHKDGCSSAIDGETPKDIRPDLIANFKNRKTQFLVNCQVLTEGFDSPSCSCVAMCRPTKSIGRYIQMLGRGLRPLPGTVDGVPESFDRKMAILTSEKPDCLILDFGGNSQHKLVDVWDVLGGNYDAETVELAESEGGKKNISDDLEKAKVLRMLQLQWEERKAIVAEDAAYSKHVVNPFGDGPAPVNAKTKPARGGASDAQIGLLIKLGVSPDEAQKYSKRQAGAVINSIAEKRCTDPQAKVLRKNGVGAH
jgi:superfamily II DNA or RNA helicase